MSESVVNNKRIAKNTIFLYFRTFIIMLISLYTSRAVLYALGETDFGIYNLVGGVVVLFAFMNSAMSAATQRYLNYELGRGDEDAVAKVFSMSINVHIGISALVLLLGETIGLWFVMTQLNIPEDRFEAALCVYHLSLIGCCVNILRIPYIACIIAYEKMNFYAYVSIVDAVLKLAIVYLLIILSNNDRLIEYSIYMVGEIVIVNLLYMYYCIKYFEVSHYKRFWNRFLFEKLVGFSGWSMFGSLANVGTSQGIGILLNIFRGVSLNAAIGIAYQVQTAIVSFVSSFQTAFSPQIVKAYATNEREDFVNLICRSSRLSYCLLFLFAPALMVSIKAILHVWLTIVPDYTAEFVFILVVYCMIDALSGPLWVSVQATGVIKRYQVLMSILIVSNIPIMAVLLLLGVSPIYVVGVRASINIFTHFVRISYLKKYLDFPSEIYMKDVMFRIFIMTLASVPLCVGLSLFTTTLLSSILVFVAIVIQNLILVVCIGVTKGERAIIINAIKTRYRHE